MPCIADESAFLYARWIVIQVPCYDTIAAAQLAYKNEKDFKTLSDCGLKTFVPDYFNETLPSFSETVGNLYFDELDSADDKNHPLCLCLCRLCFGAANRFGVGGR
jgi:DNA polymerase-1